MTKFVIRRAIQAIPVLFGITIVVYGILLAAPGGPEAKFANNPRMTQEQKDAFIKAWGLDQPIPIQYCRWMGLCNPETEGTMLGSLPVPAAFIGPSGLPNFLPAGIALVVWLSIAITMGVYAAIHRYSLFDNAATVFSYVGFAMPTFWLGIMLIFIFSGPGLNILPAGGMTETRLSPPFGSDQYWAYFGKNPIQALGDIGRHLILPVITLVVVNIAGDSRFVRASMLETLSMDFVRTAKAKGLPERVVNFKHALRNALLPVITNIGLEIPFLFTGAIVTETIFSWPGIGKLTIDATREFDYPILMGVLLVTSVLVVFANLLADVAYGYVDPRIKY
jgi:peptide/nickel transport system permease protein